MTGWSRRCRSAGCRRVQSSHRIVINDVASPFEPSGLSQSQAAALLTRLGPNELPRSRRRSLVGIASDVRREPMLLAGGVACLLLVDRSFGASPGRALTGPNAILRHLVIAIPGVCIIIFPVPAIRSILRFDAIRLIDLALVAGWAGWRSPCSKA